MPGMSRMQFICANQAHTAEPRVHLQSHTDFSIMHTAWESVRALRVVNQSEQIHFYALFWKAVQRKLCSIGNESKDTSEHRTQTQKCSCSNVNCCHGAKRELDGLAPHAWRTFLFVHSFTLATHATVAWICVSLLFRRTARLIGTGKKRDSTIKKNKYSKYDHVPTE